MKGKTGISRVWLAVGRLTEAARSMVRTSSGTIPQTNRSPSLAGGLPAEKCVLFYEL